MKILIELPTWLGDSIMTSPAIENLINNYQDTEITLLGSSTSIGPIKKHPKVVNTYVLDKHYLKLYKLILKLESFGTNISPPIEFIKEEITKFTPSSSVILNLVIL